MNWRQLNIRTSLRLGLQDTVQAVGARVHTGMSIAGIAVVIVAVATQHLILTTTIAAYPIYVFGLAWPAYTIARLRGWNRLWKRENEPIPSDSGAQINIWLAYIHPEVLLTGGFDIDCWVTDPAGNETKGRMQTPKFRACTSYPGNFDGAAKVVPGIYTVIWREQKPPGTGKWRIIDADRVTVTADHMYWAARA